MLHLVNLGVQDFVPRIFLTYVLRDAASDVATAIPILDNFSYIFLDVAKR